MKRFIVITLILITGTFSIGLGLWVMPYLIYVRAIFGTVEHDYLRIPEHSDRLLAGGAYLLPKGSDGMNNAPHWWRQFHIRNLEAPLPVSHPLLLSIPLVKNAGARRGVLMGAKIVTSKGDERLTFHSMRPLRFRLEVPEVRLWTLPLPRQMLANYRASQVWHDLFFRNLTFGLDRLSDWRKQWDNLNNVSLKELNYNLYILYLRIRFWGELPVKSLSIYSGLKSAPRSIGVVELESRHPKNREFILLSRQGKIVYGLKVEMLNNNFTAADIFRLLISSYQHKQSESNLMDDIYRQYQQLDYNQRIGYQGMIHLYSGWSHQLDNESIMQEMINFLERGGEENRIFLDPLYKYAHQRFGTTLSGKRESLKENALRRLERKMQEEGEAEIAYEKSLMDESAQDFESKRDRVNFFLRKAKERKRDDDGQSSSELQSY